MKLNQPVGLQGLIVFMGYVEEDLQNAMDKYTSWFDGKVAENSDQTSEQAI